MCYIFYIVLCREIKQLSATLWQQSKKIEGDSIGRWWVVEVFAGTQYLESDMA